MIKLGAQYVYNEGIYRVLDIAQMKDITTRKWVGSVLYENVNNPELGVFVREAQDFEGKFQMLESEVTEETKANEDGNRVIDLLAKILIELEWSNDQARE